MEDQELSALLRSENGSFSKYANISTQLNNMFTKNFNKCYKEMKGIFHKNIVELYLEFHKMLLKVYLPKASEQELNELNQYVNHVNQTYPALIAELQMTRFKDGK